jgi:tRNA(Ile)-lysidine synthase TilS/MesJ
MRELSPLGIKINSRVGKAINDYRLIEHGDKILVAVSGGKDSLTLLSFLAGILKWAPVKYELFAAHIKTDFHCASCTHNEVLTEFFEKAGVKYLFKEVKVLDENNRTSCFWCSWNKRKALFEAAAELGCNKIAFGHHKDDIVETILMNLILKGEIAAMNPCQSMFGGKMTIIRPLCLVEEKMIKDFAKEAGFAAKVCNQGPYTADLARQPQDKH